MHPPLGAHLHPMCVDAIAALHACHQGHPFLKFAGACNGVRASLDKCLQEEFDAGAIVRRDDNAKKLAAAREQRKRLEAANGGELPGARLLRGESAILRPPAPTPPAPEKA